jgi:hypothetical protein
LFIGLVTSLVADAVITDSTILDPQEEVAVSVKLFEWDTVEFSVSVSSGSIDIYIFDSENYASRLYYERTFYDITSSFQTEFTATWTDTFYIVFYNPSTTNTASISYTVEAGMEFTTQMIVNIAIAGVLLGVILVVNFTGKKNPNISS